MFGKVLRMISEVLLQLKMITAPESMKKIAQLSTLKMVLAQVRIVEMMLTQMMTVRVIALEQMMWMAQRLS